MNKTNSRPRGHGRNPRGKGKPKDANAPMSKEEAEFEKKGNKKTMAINDVSWYAHNPEMLKSAASLPFSNTTGLKLPFTDNNAVAGVMALDWIPTIGPRTSTFDPINQAANSLYSYVVHANSRNQSYDAPDLMMVVLAGAQLFSFIGHGIRAYGLMRLYDQRNSYLPKGLIRALGFDYADLRNNLAKMWFDLNELIARTDQIWIPNTIPVIERWFWMNNNVYMDDAGVKAQYYLFRPAKVYKFSETAHPTGSSLVDAGWNSSAVNTWSTYMSIVNGMFDALLDSQDRGIMFGDILKAFGQDKLYTMKEIPSDYVVVPQYDTEVLTQIENATVIGTPQGDIEISNTNRIVLEALATSKEPDTSGNFLPSQVVLNFHTQDIPTPEQIMVATRLTAVGSVCAGGTAGQSNWQAYPRTCGTEYIITAWMFYYDGAGGISVNALRSTTNYGTSLELEHTDRWATFDWAPWKYRFATVPTAAQVVSCNADRAVGDYDQYTTLDFETANKMHTTAVYSEFGVPTL